MKITIATGPIYPVPAVCGGAVPRLWEGLAREFTKRGHEVTIFAREFPGQAEEEKLGGVRYIRRGGYEQSTSIKRDLVKCLLYALKVARHVPPGNAVVTNDFWMPAILPWLKPSAGKVIPCMQRFPKSQCGLYAKCSAIAAVSKSVADAVKTQSPSVAEKVVVVPNAVDGAFLDIAKSRNGRESLKVGSPKSRGEGVRDRAVRILYVGRIHPEKGLELLAEALKSLKHGKQGAWDCVLVGPVAESEGGGGEAFAAKIRKMTEGLPVRIEKAVYEVCALANVYDQGDVFVYPSVAEKGESFGLAPLEAMARGVVPVVSDLPVFRDYLQPGINGEVFDHRSKEASANLCRVLEELISDPQKRHREGVAARITAESFSLAAIGDKYLQLFEMVVSGKRS